MQIVIKLEDKLILMVLLVILLTFLRASVIVLMPIIFLVVIKIQGLKLNKLITLVFLLIFLLSSFFGLIFHRTTIPNVLLSGYILMPLIILVTMKPSTNFERTRLLYQLFVKYSSRILYVVNFLGFVSYIFIWKLQREDALGFAYGSHFGAVHGLAIVNLLMFFYYLSELLNNRYNRFLALNTLFFLTSFIFCFYGLALICLILTIVVFLFLQWNKKFLFFAILLFGSSVFFVSRFNSRNIEYIKSNIEKAIYNPHDARKILMYFKFLDFFYESPDYLILGVGPGGYNGRVAFLLNEDSENIYTNIFGNQMPIYHRQNAYAFWNKNIVSYDKFTDGTRNKPFSSFVSLISELGVLFGLLFFAFFILNVKSNYKYLRKKPNSLFVLLSVIFILFLFLFDMIIETSEFLFFTLFFQFNRGLLTLKNKM